MAWRLEATKQELLAVPIAKFGPKFAGYKMNHHHIRPPLMMIMQPSPDPPQSGSLQNRLNRYHSPFQRPFQRPLQRPLQPLGSGCPSTNFSHLISNLMVKRNWLLTVVREVMVSGGTLVAAGGLLVVLVVAARFILALSIFMMATG